MTITRLAARCARSVKVLRRQGPRALWLFYKVHTHTIVSIERLLNVYELCHRAEREGVPGAFVECGVWRGGCAGVMAAIAHRNGGRRQVHLFDSFQGLPFPRREVDGAHAALCASGKADGELAPMGRVAASIEEVRQLMFGKLHVDPSAVFFHTGWFQHTLPETAGSIGPIAVLRLDADWYDSTKVCLDHLYERVSPGGYIIIDDYGHWEGCRRAVDEFLRALDHRAELQPIDYSGRYFRKPVAHRERSVCPQ